MGVQKSKKSLSKKKQKYSFKLKNISLSFNKETNEIHMRHHITNSFNYKGIKIYKNGV